MTYPNPFKDRDDLEFFRFDPEIHELYYNGRRLTNEYIDEMVREIEYEADPERFGPPPATLYNRENAAEVDCPQAA